MSFTRFSSGSSFKRFSQPTSTDPYDTTSIDRQIENADTRIKDAGYKPENTDKRNWFEKATNLPKGQNFLFDTLELLGRPGQAVMNAVDKKNTNMKLGEALKRGVAGQDKVRGSDLLKGTNMNPLTKTIVGTGLEIALDPLTYVPGGVFAKVGSKGAQVAKTAVGGAYKAAEQAIPSFSRFSENTLRPAAENVKDGLGYMFKPDYKKDVTLTGDKNDSLLKLERETENSRRFMKENHMTDLADTAKAAGGIDTGTDVGRLMETSLAVNGPRPYRETPTDPKLADAAQKLMNSNSEIRQFAADKGIEIPELAGYMTHILTQEEKARRASGRAFKIDVGSFGKGNPNKKILEKRKLEGSAEDINQQVGRNFFEPNAYFATGVGQQRLLDYVHAVDFRRKVLSNPEFAQPFVKGMDIGKNVVIDSNNYKFLKDSGDTLDGLGLADKVGGEYAVTPQVKMLLDRYQRVNTDEGTKAFLKAWDGMTGMWKKLAVFSPGFHVRNVAGAAWNNYISGMNTYQLTKYTYQGAKEVAKSLQGKETALMREYRSQGLGSVGQNAVEFSVRDPEKSIRKTVESASKTTAGKVKERLNPVNAFQSSRELGEVGDTVSRFALYKFSRDKGLTPEQAAAKVRETHFDYSDLTNVEQNVLKRLAPFYTWSRKNIPFQIKKFVENPNKFQNINKLRLNAQENVGIDESNMPDFMKESFVMPVSGKEGKGNMLALNLPLSDLTKVSSPLKTVTDSLTPLIKTPMELATNFSTFKKKPIQRFEGEQKQYVGGAGIPIKTAYAAENLGGQVVRGLSQYLQKPTSEDQANKYLTPSFGISSVFKEFDADKNAYFARLNQLKKLQDLILYIEQQSGEKPRTVREIKKGS